MVTKEIQTSVDGFQREEKQDIISNIKWWFSQQFSKNETNKESESDKKQKTKDRLSRAFVLTKKNMTFYLIIMCGAIAGALFMWYTAIKNYKMLNKDFDSLKQISTYNLSPNKEILSQYVDGEWEITSLDDIISVYNNEEDILTERETFRQHQQIYYQSLLEKIYLPSLNVWKDPYTNKFDITILWQKYLELDKFQDLYLIQYWSDFFKYVWNDAEANVINSISIGDLTELEWTNYFYIPVSISFQSPNKRSFLLLVNKLSMTSNPVNISLLNEFIFYLFDNIKEMKSAELWQLEQQYRDYFRWWDLYSKYASFTGMQLDEDVYMGYKNEVIGYTIYQWITQDSIWANKITLIDDDVIVKTIKETAKCDGSVDSSICFYNFRDKYRDLPYLAYWIGLNNQTSRAEWLRDFLKDLPSIIAVTNFGFERYSNASFLNNEQEQYEWTIEFNAYWRWISDEDLDEAATILWNLCFWNSDKMSPDTAYNRVQKNLAALWSTNETNNVMTLDELSILFSSIKKEYEHMTKYDKMIKLFEVWRMLNDANLCNA